MSQKTYTWAFPGGPVDKNRLPMQGTQVTSLVWEDPTWNLYFYLCKPLKTLLYIFYQYFKITP